MSYDLLVLSPHADDAAFSVGGIIADASARGESVALLTVFHSDNWLGLGESEARRSEDVAFAALQRVTLLEPLGPEAPKRDPKYASGRRLTQWLDEDDAQIDKLVDQLRGVASTAHRVLAPLGVGEHVDHQLVHWAARRLDGNIEFYEDVPYALMPDHVSARLRNLDGPAVRTPLLPAARAWMKTPLMRSLASPLRAFAAATCARSVARRRSGGTRTWDGVEHPIDVDKKLAGIACYATQWPLFFATLDEWRERLGDRERVWTLLD